MQGNCDQNSETGNSFHQSADTVPLRSLAPGQCLVVGDQSPFHVTGKLLIEGLYFRRQSPSISDFAIGSNPGAEVWLKNVVVQGTGSPPDHCHLCGIEASGGPVHAEGETPSVFLNIEPCSICM